MAILYERSYTWYPVTYFYLSLSTIIIDAHFLVASSRFMLYVCYNIHTNSNSFYFLYFLIDQNQPHWLYCMCAKAKKRVWESPRDEMFQYRWNSFLFFIFFEAFFYFRRKQSCNYKSYDVNLLLKEFSSFCRSRHSIWHTKLYVEAG